MPQITFLGSANSIPSELHGNTHMAVQVEDRVVLIDAAGDAFVRLEKAGIPLDRINDLVLTHFHPDHVSGVPLLLMNMWILGRKQPMEVYGLPHTIDRVEAMMQLYEWNTWSNLYPVVFHRIPDIEFAPVLATDEVVLTASAMKHFIPAIAVRMEFPKLGTVVTYSGDTAYCPQIIRLSKKADILIHEAAGASSGHSSASQAGEVASAAGVKCLYLVHYPQEKVLSGELIREARETYEGPIVLAEDYATINLSPEP